MAFDLTLVGTPAYNASGKFGASLSGGSGYSATDIVTVYPFTLQAWVKISANSSIQVAGGRSSFAWFGKAADNTALAHYGPGNAGTTDGTDITLASSVNIADGAWHFLKLVVTANGGTFYVDGPVVSSSAAKPAAITNNGQKWGVRAFFGTTAPTFPWAGEVDEFAVFNVTDTSTTVPASALVGNEAGLLALYKFENNGLNTVGAVGDTVAPVFSSAQVANANPNIILVTMSETLAASIPPASAWTPSGGRTATAVSLSGSVVSVTVNTPYVNGDVITIGYLKPAANPRLQDASGNATESFTAQPVTNNVAVAVVNSYDPTKILFSPYNWDVQSGYAKTINSGAYFRTSFGGASCSLTFDLTGVSGSVPKLSYRVDEFGPWITVDLAAAIAITVPTDTADFASHYLELMVRSTSEAVSRWVSQAVAVKLTGVTLAAGKALSMPPVRPLFGLYYGDSITEGINTLKSTGDTTVRSDAGQGWAYLSARLIGAEAGIVGFGRQGLTVTGNPDVPVFGSTYNLMYAGATRSFSRAPDYIVINQGTNDGSANIQSAALAVLNNILAAVPVGTKIIVLRPFNGSGATFWQNAIAASNAPARIIYVDTTGWFNTANSPDGLHPNGYENATHIAPLAATAIQSALDGAPTLTPRTLTLTLASGKDASNNAIPAANLSNLKVSFHDEQTPDITTVPRYQSAVETTNASGVLTFSFGSTLPSGGTGHLTVYGSGGVQYNGPAAVA